MSFDPRSLERLRELGRQLPKPLEEPRTPATPKARQVRHKVETEQNPEQLFRELMQASQDGTVPEHLMARLKQLEGEPSGRPPAAGVAGAAGAASGAAPLNHDHGSNAAGSAAATRVGRADGGCGRLNATVRTPARWERGSCSEFGASSLLGGAGATFVQIINERSFVRIGPNWFSCFGIQAINSLITSPLLPIVPHGEQAIICHNHGRETNPHLCFPLQIIQSVPPVRLCGHAVLGGPQPVWPVGGNRGEQSRKCRISEVFFIFERFIR